MNKLHSLLETKRVSLFDFFVLLDTNHSGTVSALEMKTGIQNMNMQLNREEFMSLWKMLHREKKEVKKQQFGNRLKKDNLRPKEP
jgi:Ca2+-binding EF-hand superfamily protein